MDALTSQIEDWLARFLAGDDAAWTDLQNHNQGRVAGHSRRALNRFPDVRVSGVETGDVQNDANLRMERKEKK